MRWYHRAPRPALWLAPLLLLPALAGCGQPNGHVSGKVLQANGQPLPGGTVTFRPADPKANTVNRTIGPDGQYDATLPVGDVTIAVDNRELQPRQQSPRPELPPGIKLPPGQDGGVKAAEAPNAEEGKPAGKYVPIPEKFYQTDTSGLKYTVKSGNQSYDIELK